VRIDVGYFLFLKQKRGGGAANGLNFSIETDLDEGLAANEEEDAAAAAYGVDEQEEDMLSLDGCLGEDDAMVKMRTS
jgi:hypothetical protein